MNAPVAVKPRRAVVLVNLGTPDAPTVPAVRRYLAEFLSDPRVIDLPGIVRWLLLRLVILPFRPKRSAHAYQQIWTDAGSPLLANSKRQREALEARMPGVKIVLAMRYGTPSLAMALEEVRAAGISESTLVPLYPQHAEVTTGSTTHAWKQLGATSTHVPAFFSEPGFVEASAARLREVVSAHRIDHVLFSYHGLPVSQVARSCDSQCVHTNAPCEGELCYRAQCLSTTEHIAAAAQLTAFTTAFQSRLKGKWIEPFTEETLVALARRGVRRVAVTCPSFVADCLETLEEIGLRAKAAFLAAGGEALVLVPAVNDDPRFIEMLATVVERSWERA